ncbi:hypothetical protein CASFOL_013200 [Castilleja foliolosa]|uniref:No apical meristem-associated C-terminal domain-containing protein n=1 Tax=Castilleja foliolosa TaxID=1961234 RepID=A0ABD3DNF0_9LAMI
MDSQNSLYSTFDDEFEVEAIPSSFPFDGSQSNNGKKRVPRKHNFTVEEDLLLVSAWLNVSLDAVTSNNQTHKTYWERIHDYFHEHKIFQSERNSNSLMKRWSNINLAVGKFCGCFAQIEGLNQSGKTDQDKIQDSKALYQKIQGLAFPYEHCWNILRFQQKWLQVIDKHKSKKKTKRFENDSPSNSSPIDLEDNECDVFTSSERPYGRDAAKEKIKNRKTKFSENSPDMRMASCMEQFVECKQKHYEERKSIRERDHEEAIMKMDLSNMNEFQVMYWKKKQEEILQGKGWIE